MAQFIDVQLKAKDLHKHFSKILFKNLKNFWNYAKKNTLVFGNAGDEKNLHPDQIYFFSQFSGDILFSSLVSFTFFVFCFFFFLLVCLFFAFFLLVCLFFTFFCLFVCFLLFFACLFVFCFFFCLFVCFLKLKIYILIHIPLCGRVSDHKIFTQPISGIVYFFWLLFFWPYLRLG